MQINLPVSRCNRRFVLSNQNDAIVIDKDITKNLCFFFSQRESLILSRLMDML